ncbi:MAG: RNA methyltransferase [Bacilli bacterium]|nr:RNA methyltransferase [Bacilli bacterium]
MLYSSLENSKIKELKKLNQKKYRDKTNLFLVEGEHLLLEAHKSGYLKEVLLLEGTDLSLDIPINYMTSNVEKYISALDTPTGMIGICEKKSQDIIGDKILILDDVQDPGNLGTIIRSAVAFNIDTIILSEKCADVYSSKVSRASQGMLFHINILTKNLEEFVLELQTQGYRVLGTKVTLGNNLKTLEKMKKFAIIMGNEGNGVKKELLDICDEYIYIKMNESCESLNVAVATSIILYELDK